VQTKQKRTQKQSYKTHPLSPEMEATLKVVSTDANHSAISHYSKNNLQK